MAAHTLEWWQERLAGSRSDAAEVTLQMPLQQSINGGSGAFLGLCSDGEQYWIKVPNGPQGSRVPCTEQIVGRVGHLIDAAVCTVATVEITGDCAGRTFRPGRQLSECIGHGSLNVPGAVREIKGNLGDRETDDNSRRHATYYALYDWCWGNDPQCLVAVDDDFRFYSHDHGHFLPPGNGTWNPLTVSEKLEEPRQLAVDSAGIDFETSLQLANRLEAIDADRIATELSKIPSAWEVGDHELAMVGYFLEKRAPYAAQRLRARVGATP